MSGGGWSSASVATSGGPSILYDCLHAPAGDPEVEARVKETYNSVFNGDPYQVFPVPATPLELLVSSPATAGLVSDETVFTANHGLWRIRIFNEFVRMQADYNTRSIAELRDSDLPDTRREALAKGAVWITKMLHAFGVAGANVEGGWYARLKLALDEDIDRLTDKRAEGFFDYGESRRWLLIGDLGMTVLVIACHHTHRAHGLRLIHRLSPESRFDELGGSGPQREAARPSRSTRRPRRRASGRRPVPRKRKPFLERGPAAN